ncbi:MAG TPA: hypothetical protein ENH88_18585 [Pseudoalteromonas prydzensis]|uniref:Uncharacterized protein n=1 Tax=Pseudoalteromonas prydzensis TaxID=182141 RepID=A0A7V1D1X7_9GAMM|nr:hypothetical protein [Pseudoalteromonas prydzensis]HEA18406.1 hypothetical protein [Pseudoalteromonas prydzensis]
MDFTYWYIILAIVFLINLAVSVFLAKRNDLERFQKGTQIALVWLIPFFAAIGLWLFHRTQDSSISPSKPFGGGASTNTNFTGTGD